MLLPLGRYDPLPFVIHYKNPAAVVSDVMHGLSSFRVGPDRVLQFDAVRIKHSAAVVVWDFENHVAFTMSSTLTEPRDAADPRERRLVCSWS